MDPTAGRSSSSASGGGGRGRSKGRGSGRGGGGRSGSRRPRHRSGGRRHQHKKTTSNEDAAEPDAARTGSSQSEGQQKKQAKTTQNQSQNNNARKKKFKELFAPHLPLDEALRLYAEEPTKYIRGKFRVSGSAGQRIKAFVSCDRGGFRRDVIISGVADTNRALDGDVVFVEILGPVEDLHEDGKEDDAKKDGADGVADELAQLAVDGNKEGEHSGDMESEDTETDDEDEDEEVVSTTWRQDTMQRSLWNPEVDIKRHASIKSEYSSRNASILSSVGGDNVGGTGQMRGRVAHVCASRTGKPRIIVGTLKRQSQGQHGRIILVPSNRALPFFVVPRDAEKYFSGDDASTGSNLFKAEYNHTAWMSGMRFPPCRKVEVMGNCFDPEDETQALLTEFDVNHGEFHPAVLCDVNGAVKSGRTKTASVSGAEGTTGEDLGWEPTKEMRKGRRDYTEERIFTIDPTTAKDLDDALHIKRLPNNQIELGVHIADVSHFIKPHSAVDKEAAYRATTVYLVDRVIPMLPKPLCEIACSLNENVERLAFSCVWTMNLDGTLATEEGSENEKKGGRGKKRRKEKVWYGRTVIKSCARLDYNTAQNIIDGKCGNPGQTDADISEELWPRSRRPTGGHTIMEVASDVRLMHKVAMARRRLRFDNGALALHGVKLVFRLGDDNKTPKLCGPYPLVDSNRLVEEYMLMANYLVAQRLITHAGDLALLRQHPPPLEQGLDEVAQVAQGLGLELDTTNSASIQNSLRKISHECTDDVILQGITELMMTPMQPAEYIAAGAVDDPTEWSHFALNIPYYTHFTSPIRRYADVIVHRLLQATLDGPQAVKEYYQSVDEISTVTDHCNDKRMGSKKAQERSDRVFLSLYLREHPIESAMGIVVSVGEKSFTVFVPSLGLSTRVNLEDHEHLIYEPIEEIRKKIIVRRRGGGAEDGEGGPMWTGGSEPLEIRVFAKIAVACICKETSPIDVIVKLVGPCSG
mmetsp:Transcript_20216/g.57981  ORF Transcript_20216/g.57981 Transcript_20216/m.57981 type:complete len:980 (+) Transcript_20216:2-2941(+)